MSKEKRGGARLDKSASPKKTAPKKTDQPAVATDAAAKKGLSKGAKIAIIVAAVFLALLICLFALYKSWARLPSLPDLPDLPTPTVNPFTGEEEPVGNRPIDSERKEGYYTFLVVGRDTGGGGNTDTIMLASYDIPNQTVNVVSIPRDTMVNARHPGANRKINAVWNLGRYYAKEGEKKEGIEYLREAVGDMTGIVPDFYVIVNWNAFGRLVDAIGGVDFEVPFDMKYKDPTQDLVIDQAAGYRHLSGRDAMEVVRWRHDNTYSKQYRDGDLGRVRTQQALMKAIIVQCLKIENVTKINEFAEIFTDEVETNLSVGNLVAFAERAILGGLKSENVTFSTAPVEGVYVKKTSYVQLKPEEFLGLLNEGFNPYTDELQMENLSILQYSASRGYYTYQGTGTGTAVTPTKAPANPTTRPTQANPTATQTPTPKPSGEEPSPKPSAAASEGEPTEPPSQTQEAEPTPEPTAGSTPEPTPEPAPEPTPEPTPTPTYDPNELGIPME